MMFIPFLFTVAVPVQMLAAGTATATATALSAAEQGKDEGFFAEVENPIHHDLDPYCPRGPTPMVCPT